MKNDKDEEKKKKGKKRQFFNLMAKGEKLCKLSFKKQRQAELSCLSSVSGNSRMII